jgi:hypothetical protein
MQVLFAEKASRTVKVEPDLAERGGEDFLLVRYDAPSRKGQQIWGEGGISVGGLAKEGD